MTKLAKLLYVIFYFSFAFIISAAFNYGFTRFYLGIPFMLFAIAFAYKVFRNKIYGTSVLVFCILAIVTNKTLELNPMVFPILNHGQVEILVDGVYRKYSDESGHFVPREAQEFSCKNCGEFTDTIISANTILDVIAISIGHADVSTSAQAVTEIGSFSANKNGYIFTKKLESKFFSHAGIMMYYPILPTMIPGLISSFMPDVPVIIIDDESNKKNAHLNYSVAKTRGVKKNDEVRLNCLSNLKHGSNKLCSLIFSGFDRKTPYPRNNPNYGIYAPMSVSISHDGTPDSKILKY